MKLDDVDERLELSESLSSWRAWIEICVVCFYGVSPFGRSPHGERGLKSYRPLRLH